MTKHQTSKTFLESVHGNNENIRFSCGKLYVYIKDKNLKFSIAWSILMRNFKSCITMAYKFTQNLYRVYRQTFNVYIKHKV